MVGVTANPSENVLPVYLSAQVETDLDVLVDPDIAHENLMEAVTSLSESLEDLPSNIEPDAQIGLFTLTEGVLRIYAAKNASKRDALRFSCEWGMPHCVVDGKLQIVAKPQRAGTAYQRRSYAESWANAKCA